MSVNLDEVWLRNDGKIVIHKIGAYETALKLDTISMVQNGETWWGKFVGWLILSSPLSLILLLVNGADDIYFGYWFISLLIFLFISSLSYILIIVSQGRKYIFPAYSSKKKESLKRLKDEIDNYMT